MCDCDSDFDPLDCVLSDGSYDVDGARDILSMLREAAREGELDAESLRHLLRLAEDAIDYISRLRTLYDAFKARCEEKASVTIIRDSDDEDAKGLVASGDPF